MTESISSGKKLYNLLKQAWDEDEKQPTKHVWAKVLGVNPRDTFDVSDKLSNLFELFNDVRDDIQGIDINRPEKYLNALSKIQYILMCNNLMTTTWGSIKPDIGEETLDLIDSCGDLIISNTQGLYEISPEQLEGVQQQIRDLQDEIRNSEIDKETKVFLTNELRKIEDAILNYQIRGSSGLDKISNQVTGGIMFKLPQMRQKAQEMGKQVIDVALKVNGIITLSEKLAKLPEGLKEILPVLLPGNGR